MAQDTALISRGHTNLLVDGGFDVDQKAFEQEQRRIGISTLGAFAYGIMLQNRAFE
jgi:hypothetical protein